MKKLYFLFYYLLFSFYLSAQIYPSFGPEIKVTINGLTFDAMEPFISSDGNTLFFNSLNSGGNTNLYYATRINDSIFNYVGLVGGTYDSSPSHLDAVASLDSSNTFFWVSLRNYPTVFENLKRGIYFSGNVNNISPVYGNFNIYTPGWLIMDAAINPQGNLLYYCNAYFNSCAFGMPCDARLGIAQKVNDSTFNKLINTDALLSNVNNTNYIVYAPQVTTDGLELYFTRILKTTVNSEICVSVRSAIVDTFSIPQVIHSNLGFVPEAATITTNKQKIYYHQKNSTSTFEIYLRYRNLITDIENIELKNEVVIYPNPSHTNISFNVNSLKEETGDVEIYSSIGKLVFSNKSTKCNSPIDVSFLAKGIYIITIKNKNKIYKNTFIKE